MKGIYVYALILFFLAGIYIGYNFKKERVIVKKEIEYKTIYKSDPKKISFEDAIGHLQSPLKINYTLKENWIYITAFDSFKSTKKDVKLGTVTDWKKYALYGAVAVTAAVVVSSLLTHTSAAAFSLKIPLF